MSKLLKLQIAILTAGAIFAWYSTIKNFVRFYHLEGTIFKISNCAIPNPVTQACFYGAVGFVVALIWAAIIFRNNSAKQQHYLLWFLWAGTVFAWFNVTKEFIAFYSARTGPALGCSAIPITNPFLTPCFTGASIFLIATILAGFIHSKNISNKAS